MYNIKYRSGWKLLISFKIRKFGTIWIFNKYRCPEFIQINVSAFKFNKFTDYDWSIDLKAHNTTIM